MRSGGSRMVRRQLRRLPATHIAVQAVGMLLFAGAAALVFLYPRTAAPEVSAVWIAGTAAAIVCCVAYWAVWGASYLVHAAGHADDAADPLLSRSF